MCSVSFIPRAGADFVLAMNRDESRLRTSALPPEVHHRDGVAMLFPRELSGGTWIGVNSSRMAFSLINWYSQPERTIPDAVSRGAVVRALLSARNREAAALLLQDLPLERMNPFRLIVISSTERSLTEWRCDRGKLQVFRLAWRRQHWFSSALNEARVNEIRGRIFARITEDSLDAQSLRKLHSSHAPEPGPLSVCMHREDACTVSYTEISLQGQVASTYYIAGAPCSRARRFRSTLVLDAGPALSEIA
jgi:Transport and Golgi organisation 2